LDVARLESFILSKMSSTRIPGLSIAVVRGGEVVYARGFGFRDVERGLAATPRTVYGIGSVTKSFTAIAVLKLVEEGMLSLDDEVSKYVTLRLEARGKPVRIHHLLTHSSGIPALAYAEAFIRSQLGLDGTWLPVAKAEDVISFMSDYAEWVHAEPGTRYFYLNEGYVLLGYVVSKVSGTRYEDFVRKYILRPLGMSRTYFEEAEVSADPDVATPYIVDREGRYVRSRFPYGITADGGLLSNCEDMARYVSMLIGRGELGGVRILGREYVEAMERKYIDVPSGMFGDDGYGYGLTVTERFLGRKLVRHSGSVLVYTAFMGYLPDDGVGVVVLANSSGYPLSLIGMYALALALGRDPYEAVPYLKYEEVLEKLQGTYETYKGTYRLQVRRMGDFLAVEYRDRYREVVTPLAPVDVREDYARFYTLSAGGRVEAEFFIDGGRVVMVYERYRLVKRS
jgi:CubicO group peptidase (beta-lactamase class C family)